MDTNAVVWKRTTRGTALKTGKWLWLSLLVLLLVLALSACGQTSSLTAGSSSRDSQSPSSPQTCVRVGRDSCDYILPDSQPASSQQICVRVGYDSCDLLIVRR
jgi:hypothetical protein